MNRVFFACDTHFGSDAEAIICRENRPFYDNAEHTKCQIKLWKSSYSAPVKRTIHYIHVHLHDRLKVQEIADEIGISRDYLSTIFTKEVGESLHQYILQEKVKVSKDMLTEGRSYEQISYDLGFCSETHFIQCFKKVCQMTPGEYKKRLQF